jgi:D-aminopeptidase
MLTIALTLAIAGHVLIALLEYLGRHPTANAAAAAAMVLRGRYARTFWFGGVGVAVLGLALAVLGWAGVPVVALAAAVLVQPALLAYESVFIRAAQDVPLS